MGGNKKVKKRGRRRNGQGRDERWCIMHKCINKSARGISDSGFCVLSSCFCDKFDALYANFNMVLVASFCFMI